MKSQVHVITLAVEDLLRALRFYSEGLGLESEGIIATEFQRDERSGAGAIAIFRLDGGLILSIYPRAELAHDAKVALMQPSSGEFSIGQLVDSREAVDAALALAEAAGATITDQPHDRPFGIYSGYFKDPDGHLWEIIWNPAMQPS
jgi:catechol 2,3-dioxygenase-like lactoylglutathione lyase family enzyme